jgi:tRNA1Val (adenine37-N6)-methyltransferase
MKSNDYFEFKQFTINQERCAHKVGTDGVLLGAWADLNFSVPKEYYRGLDVGAGTGLIALMLAQRRTNLLMDAVEIDEKACYQCIENKRNSPFGDRIFPKLFAFQDFKPDTLYDLIVSNPPYFTNSMKSPDYQRNEARHNDGLSIKTLIEKSLQMLCDDGRIALILPVENAKELDLQISIHNLHILRRTDVITVEGQAPKRFMIELAHYKVNNPQFNTLTLETGAHKRTAEYKELAKDFYLD